MSESLENDVGRNNRPREDELDAKGRARRDFVGSSAFGALGLFVSPAAAQERAEGTQEGLRTLEPIVSRQAQELQRALGARNVPDTRVLERLAQTEFQSLYETVVNVMQARTPDSVRRVRELGGAQNHPAFDALVNDAVNSEHPSVRFKAALSLGAISKSIAYNEKAKNPLFAYTELSGVFVDSSLSRQPSRARLQCDSGSHMAVMAALSMPSKILRAIEGEGRLVLVKSAIGPHMQWGVWEQRGDGGRLRLFESTLLGPSNAVIEWGNSTEGRSQLARWNIMNVTDAREDLGLTRNGAAPYYVDSDMREQPITVQSGDLELRYNTSLQPLTPVAIARSGDTPAGAPLRRRGVRE